MSTPKRACSAPSSSSSDGAVHLAAATALEAVAAAVVLRSFHDTRADGDRGRRLRRPYPLRRLGGAERRSRRHPRRSLDARLVERRRAEGRLALPPHVGVDVLGTRGRRRRSSSASACTCRISTATSTRSTARAASSCGGIASARRAAARTASPTPTAGSSATRTSASSRSTPRPGGCCGNGELATTDAPLTGAPLVARGVVVATNTADAPGGRGMIVALDAASGRVRWSFDTIAKPWAHPGLAGGGGAWQTPTVDDAGHVWVGTANPNPWGGSRAYPNGGMYPGAVALDRLGARARPRDGPSALGRPGHAARRSRLRLPGSAGAGRIARGRCRQGRSRDRLGPRVPSTRLVDGGRSAPQRHRPVAAEADVGVPGAARRCRDAARSHGRSRVRPRRRPLLLRERARHLAGGLPRDRLRKGSWRAGGARPALGPAGLGAAARRRRSSVVRPCRTTSSSP